MTLGRLLRIVRLRARSVSGHDQADQELGAELAFHFEQLVAENVADGLTPDDARAAARRSLGNASIIEEECRDQRRVGWLEDFWRDAIYGLGTLRATRTFTATAVLSLGLGIGGGTAILAVMDSVYHGSLPFRDPDHLVIARSFAFAAPQQSSGVSVRDYLAWQERSRSFAAMGASLVDQQDIRFDTGIEHVHGQAFTPSLFEALDAKPWRGRTFSGPEAERVVVIGYELWRRQLGSDPHILNRTVEMNGSAARIIGVMPPDFHYVVDDAQYWVPLSVTRENSMTARFLIVGARLRPDVSFDEAQTELSQIGRDLDPAWGVHVISVRRGLFGWMLPSLYTMTAGVVLLLLIACANVSVLLLARSSARLPEMKLRSALGAGRGRLIRQSLTETLLLGMLGFAAGLPLAWGAMRLAPVLTPQPGSTHLPLPVLSVRVLLGALSVAGIATLVSGVLPALTCVGIRMPRSNALRGLMLSAQIAVALMLLTSAGLLATSFLKLSTREYNFNTRSLATFDYRIPPQEYLHLDGGTYLLRPHPVAMIERVFERLRRVPGATVAGISHPPVNSLILPRFEASVEGSSVRYPVINFQVTADYFHVIQAQMIAGRDIEDGDTRDRPQVAVINETLAKRLWPGKDPLHKRFGLSGLHEGTPVEVVGVIRDIPFRSTATNQEPAAYTPFLQAPAVVHGQGANMFGQMTFVMRGASSAELLAAGRMAVAEIDPRHAVSSEGTVEGRIHGRTREGAFYVAVFLTMACVAGLIAGIGVYGTTAYAIEGRRREIGIRLAIGAGALEVIAMLARWTLGVLGVGILVGIPLSAVAARLIQDQLWSVAWWQPEVILLVSAVTVFSIALVATLVPSLRAARVDPAVTIRCE
jgi:putative ABC transport system permease protein